MGIERESQDPCPIVINAADRNPDGLTVHDCDHCGMARLRAGNHIGGGK